MLNVRTAQRWLRQRSEFQRLCCGRWPLALLLCFGAPAGLAAGDDPTVAAPGWVRLDTNLSVNREILDTHWSSVVRTPSSPPDYALANAPSLVAWSSLSKVPSIIEVSPTRLAASEPQVYFRPQFALGGSSESLRSWLRVAGIDAAHCMAPLMKMHSSFAGSSSHANVSLSARCSIH